MGLNKDKKKKLAEVLAKRRAFVAGVGTSSPATSPPSATSAPIQLNQPLLTTGRKGWWPSIRRTRALARPSSSRGRGWAKSWRPLTLRLVGSLQPSGITPQALPPRATLLFMKVGRRVPPEANKYLLLPSSLPFSKMPSNAFKTKRW